MFGHKRSKCAHVNTTDIDFGGVPFGDYARAASNCTNFIAWAKPTPGVNLGIEIDHSAVKGRDDVEFTLLRAQAFYFAAQPVDRALQYERALFVDGIDHTAPILQLGDIE